MSTPLFSKRHYEWLAAFSRQHLTAAQRVALRQELYRRALDDGRIFSSEKFDRACGNTEYVAGFEYMKRSAQS